MAIVYSIIGLFALGALMGMYLLAMVLQSKETPKFVTLLHGLFVAVALVMLIVYACNDGPDVTASIILFIMAAAGGVVLVYRDITARKIPKWLAIAHGLLAVTGFVILAIKFFAE
jgi:peptidoglycan/LPS O-acetylase OafA/YrhL